MVVCGPVILTPDRPDTATNPVVIMEVLSDATRDYDRKEKFDLYKAIPTLREYVLIEQDRAYVEHFHLMKNGSWKSQTRRSLKSRMTLPSIGVSVSLSELYNRAL